MQRFELTEDHVKLLRAAKVGWDNSEFGAPGIDPWLPYGNSDAIRDIWEILGWTPPDGYDRKADRKAYLKLEDRAVNLHHETRVALQVILATGSFTPGVYECDDCMRNWRPITLSEE